MNIKTHYTFKAIQKIEDKPTYRLMPYEWKDTGWRATLINNKWMVFNERKPRTIVNYPILYDNGSLGWDNPYAIPKYIKKRFFALINLLKDSYEFIEEA